MGEDSAPEKTVPAKMPANRLSLTILVLLSACAAPIVMLSLDAWIPDGVRQGLAGGSAAVFLVLMVAIWRSPKIELLAWRILGVAFLACIAASLAAFVLDNRFKATDLQDLSGMLFLLFILVVPTVKFLITGKMPEKRVEQPVVITDTYYFQRPDESFETIKDQSMDGVLKAFREYDWASGIEEYKKIKDLPPSLYLGSYGDPHFLHIGVKESGSAEVEYFFAFKTPPKKKKRGQDQDELYRKDVPFSDVEKLIRAHFAKDVDELVRIMSA